MSRRTIKVPKDYRPLVAQAVAQGWTLTQTRHGHPKLTSPEGYATPVPSSSGSRGVYKSVVLRLRSQGVDV